jgi:hypothetical protein
LKGLAAISRSTAGWHQKPESGLSAVLHRSGSDLPAQSVRGTEENEEELLNANPS